jgi:hypothetical protein
MIPDVGLILVYEEFSFPWIYCSWDWNYALVLVALLNWDETFELMIMTFRQWSAIDTFKVFRIGIMGSIWIMIVVNVDSGVCVCGSKLI